ncbi:cysteine hydrolase family protein [candidate division KSB1 bacterium]
MKKIPDNTALIIIDVQKAMDDPAMGERNNPQAEKNIAKILKNWRETGRPVFHIQHVSWRKGSIYSEDSPGCEIKDFAKPHKDEPLIQKHFQSAFIGTELGQLLENAKLNNLIFAGFLTDQCVASTVEVANNALYNVFLVADACGTIDCPGYNGKLYKADDIHNQMLGNLQRDGVTILETKALLEALKKAKT